MTRKEKIAAAVWIAIGIWFLWHGAWSVIHVFEHIPRSEMKRQDFADGLGAMGIGIICVFAPFIHRIKLFKPFGD